MRAAAVAICLFTLVGTAHATVDVVINTTIVYQHPQLEAYCYQQMPVAASVGIPGAVLLDAALAPSFAYRNMPLTYCPAPNYSQIGGLCYANLNEISRGKPIKHNYKLDSYLADGTYEYRAELDVTALATFNGTTTAGRQKTVKQAKMALLAAAKISSSIGSGRYRLFLTFKGLPSQTSLTGKVLPATTTWPYTAGSQLLLDIQKEIISAACPASGKTDTISDSVPEPSVDEAAGCSMGYAARRAVVPASLALLALGCVFVVVFRRSTRRG